MNDYYSGLILQLLDYPWKLRNLDPSKISCYSVGVQFGFNVYGAETSSIGFTL